MFHVFHGDSRVSSFAFRYRAVPFPVPWKDDATYFVGCTPDFCGAHFEARALFEFLCFALNQLPQMPPMAAAIIVTIAADADCCAPCKVGEQLHRLSLLRFGIKFPLISSIKIIDLQTLAPAQQCRARCQHRKPHVEIILPFLLKCAARRSPRRPNPQPFSALGCVAVVKGVEFEWQFHCYGQE